MLTAQNKKFKEMHIEIKLAYFIAKYQLINVINTYNVKCTYSP